MHDEDAAEIIALADPLSLWRLLVTDPLGPKLAPALAIDTFQRLHGSGATGSYDSAVLLCTDRRWRNVTAKVITGIADSGILADCDQDRLANSLLWQQELRYEHPLWWIGNTFVEIDLDSPGPSRPARLEPNMPVTACRYIWPPLRTWAAGWILGRQLASVAEVLDCARSLPARDGTAVVTGAVRAVSNLADDQARTVLDAALSWRHKTPRKAALQRLLADGEDELVHTLAHKDSDASIRQWASRQLTGSTAPPTLFD